MPFLSGRYVGRMVDGQLKGTVERTGRELTNQMTGEWTLWRPKENEAR